VSEKKKYFRNVYGLAKIIVFRGDLRSGFRHFFWRQREYIVDKRKSGNGFLALIVLSGIFAICLHPTILYQPAKRLNPSVYHQEC